MHTRSICLIIACVASAGYATAADMPQRKEGLWEIKAESDARNRDMPPMKQCIDAKTDAELQKHAMRGEGGPGRQECAKQSFKKTATGWEADSVCKHGGTTATTHAVMSGDFSNAYTIDSQTHFDPPMNGTADARHKVSVRWLGACPAGWKGGDIEVNGHRFNTLEMQKMQGGMPPGGKMTPEQMKQMKQMMEAMKKQQGGQQ